MGNFHKELDFGIDFDKIVEAAKEFGAKIREMGPELKTDWFEGCFGQEQHGQDRHGPESGRQRWYSYPPANSYTDADMNLVWEFDLAGLDSSSVSVAFQGDFLVLDARLAGPVPEAELRYTRHGFRPRDLRRQKYLVPADDYAQDRAAASLKHGVLKVSVPPKDFPEGSGVKVDIVKEGN